MNSSKTRSPNKASMEIICHIYNFKTENMYALMISNYIKLSENTAVW
jgi:hypothetical protein